MKRNQFFEKTYTSPAYRVLLHLLFWAALFGSYVYYSSISFNAIRETPATWLLALKSAVVLAAAFYPLMYLIWPRWLARKRWGAAGFSLVTWLLVVAALDAWGDLLVFGSCTVCMQHLAASSPDYYRFLHRAFLDIVLVRVLTGGFLYQLVLQLAFPVAIKLGRSYFVQTVRQLQLAQDNLQLEFNFLKSQVNPHFLFNTLNNLYALVQNDRKEQASTTLDRLSGFLRYTLYETGGEKIPLQKEVRLLQDYTELEKLRLNETEVRFRFDADRDDYTVPPLLFMPALENAFKYTEDRPGTGIDVCIKAANGQLDVTIQNDTAGEPHRAEGGIGLQNLQKRVQHYYGGEARYSAGAANGVYLFQLHCILS